MSRQAKTTTEDFQSLAFATKQYGINAEQIADISKDIADRIGEFSAAGTGTFQDYADVMKLTKKEARAVAMEFESLSSEQVIGKMVSQMEDAGVSGNKMTFVLESMGNDLSRLIPLFSNNSSELNKMKSRFNDVNSSMQITAVQAEKLKDVSTTFDLMTSSFGNATTAISATLAPVMDDFFNDIIKIVPDATQTIIDFVNSFLDAENITSQRELTKRLEESAGNLVDLEDELAKAKTRTMVGSRGQSFNQEAQIQGVQTRIDKEKEVNQTIVDRIALLKSEEELADAKRQKGGQIGGETGEGVVTGIGTGDEIRAIEDRFKTEEELLKEKLENDLITIGDNNELKLKLEDEFLEALFEMTEAADLRVSDAAAKAEKKRVKQSKKDNKDELRDRKNLELQKLNNQEAAIGLGRALNSSLLEDNKGVSAGLIIADTAVGISKSLAISPYDYVNVGIIAATGALNLANALGASRGGGSISTGAASGGGIPSAPQQPDFTQETSSLDFTDSSSGGSQTLNITVPDGDEIGEAIANWLKNAERTGNI